MNIIFVCPECESKKVLVSSIQTWDVNTGDYWCESVKTYDFDSPSKCLDCGWTVERHELLQVNIKGNK